MESEVLQNKKTTLPFIITFYHTFIITLLPFITTLPFIISMYPFYYHFTLYHQFVSLLSPLYPLSSLCIPSITTPPFVTTLSFITTFLLYHHNFSSLFPYISPLIPSSSLSLHHHVPPLHQHSFPL